MLIAYFLLVLVAGQEWPVVLGPYDLTECFDVREFLDRRGYEMSGCEVLPVSQHEDAKLVHVPYLP